eukprot:scaffold22652_cov153-Cylindrotheca_fusiformis.AAC.2
MSKTVFSEVCLVNNDRKNSPPPLPPPPPRAMESTVVVHANNRLLLLSSGGNCSKFVGDGNVIINSDEAPGTPELPSSALPWLENGSCIVNMKIWLESDGLRMMIMTNKQTTMQKRYVSSLDFLEAEEESSNDVVIGSSIVVDKVENSNPV